MKVLQEGFELLSARNTCPSYLLWEAGIFSCLMGVKRSLSDGALPGVGAKDPFHSHFH